MFCPNCGKANNDDALHCVSCGCALNGSSQVSAPQTDFQQSSYNQSESAAAVSKSKVAAGLLGIFLGAFGAHNFYLGFKKKAIIQLVITLVGSVLFGIGPVAMEIWGIVEGIMYLVGSKNTDADGNQLI